MPHYPITSSAVAISPGVQFEFMLVEGRLYFLRKRAFLRG
jgi:hypothetical protein